MPGLSGWELGLLALAALIALGALVRLMRNRRDQLLEELRRQAAKARRKPRR